MKKYLALFLFLGLASCDNDSQEDSVPLNASKIVGSWQIVSESYSIGGPQINVAVKNGGIYNFGLDGTFTFEYAKDTLLDYSGTYNFEEDILTLGYMQDGGDITRKIKLIFEDDMVILIPTDPVCIEGCSTTLRKLD